MVSVPPQYSSSGMVRSRAASANTMTNDAKTPRRHETLRRVASGAVV